MEPVLIYEHEVLGSAYSAVNPGYQGACRMEYKSPSGARGSAVFPNPTEAESAARFAVGELGGYAVATVTEAPGWPPTHEKYVDWAFE